MKHNKHFSKLLGEFGDHISDLIQEQIETQIDYYDYKGIKLSYIEQLFMAGYYYYVIQSIIYKNFEKEIHFFVAERNLVYNKEIKVNGKKYKIDFVFEDENGFDENIAFELDGYLWHGDNPDKFDADKKRERAIQSKGYKVIRFSGKEIYKDVTDVMSEVENIFMDIAFGKHLKEKDNGKA